MLVRSVFKYLAVFIAIGSLALAGCSSGDDDNDSSGSAATGATSTQTSTSQTAASTGGGNGASADLAVTLAEGGDLGSYLVGPNGHTLYVFLKDAPNTVNCKGDCLQIWPPLLLEDGQKVAPGAGIEGEFGSVDTPSGKQVTYNETPLYYFVTDAAPGDTKGHLVSDIWFVARPETASTAVVVADDDYLVGPTGLTLYTFDRDDEGVSNCSGECLTNWPALTTPADLPPMGDGAGGELATITRDDGATQVTYNGDPLYYYIGDAKPGDKTGDGVGGVWHIAAP